MKAFLWGLGAAAASLTKPDPTKIATECLNNHLTSLLSQSSLSKSEQSFVVLVQLEKVMFEVEGELKTTKC